MNGLSTILGLACGGALGAISRWALSGTLKGVTLAGLPWGTLSVNLLGCLGFGLAYGWLSKTHLDSSWLKLFLLTGFMGALTTFSTYAFENLELLTLHGWGLLALNLLIQNGLGLALVFIGLKLTSA